MTRTVRVIAAIVAVYLCFGFIAWEFDPGEWVLEGRVMCVAFSVFAALFAFLSEDLL